MRIALVCPYSLDVPGGVATHVLGLARWLRHEGHDAFVVAPGTNRQDHGVEVHLMGRSKGFAFNGSTANLAIAPAQARRAKRLVLAADVVHVHEPLTPGVGFAAARAAKRLVVTHHAQFTLPAPAGWVLRRRSASLGPRRSIAVSKAAARTARLVAGVEATVIPNAIELPTPRAGGEGPSTEAPVVLFVGRRDDPRKGYPVFEAIAGRLRDEARFVAVGPGTSRGGPVEVHPQASSEELHGWLAGAGVVVAPNLRGESFGLVLVEALAHGAGLVASDLPAFRDVVGEADVASWFRAGDVDDGVRALRQRLRTPADPARARDSVRRYSWDVVGPAVLRQYRAAVLG